MYGSLVIACGSAANLLFAAMFVARVAWPAVARGLGLAGTAMAIPLLAAAILAAGPASRGNGDWWDVGLPLVFVAFAVVEIGVDVLLGGAFRSTRWLWPYLAAFYLAQWAVIGAAFRVDRAGGFVVLITYFVCLAATAFSYASVGHGSS